MYAFDSLSFVEGPTVLDYHNYYYFCTLLSLKELLDSDTRQQLLSVYKIRGFYVQVHRADYLNGRTALHFAAVSGHTRCMRLVLADFMSSVPYLWNPLQIVNSDDSLSVKNYSDERFYINTMFFF